MIDTKETTDILLKLKIVQLEGKVALYESLMQDLSKTETIQRIAEDIKVRLENISKVWSKYKLLGSKSG